MMFPMFFHGPANPVERVTETSAARKPSAASKAPARPARARWRRHGWLIVDAATGKPLDWFDVAPIGDYRGRDHALPIFPSRTWPEMMVRGYPLPNLRSETGRKLVVRKVWIEEAR